MRQGVVALQHHAAGAEFAVVVVELTGAQAARRVSVAIAAPRRLNDREESPSPIKSRRGLTGPFPVSLPVQTYTLLTAGEESYGVIACSSEYGAGVVAARDNPFLTMSVTLHLDRETF